MSRNVELEAQVIVLEAILKQTVLPLWKKLVPEDERAQALEALKSISFNSGDRHLDEGGNRMIEARLDSWRRILTQG